jgi:hypothetical protein
VEVVANVVLVVVAAVVLVVVVTPVDDRKLDIMLDARLEYALLDWELEDSDDDAALDELEVVLAYELELELEDCDKSLLLELLLVACELELLLEASLELIMLVS